jgi:hypothetical protein
MERTMKEPVDYRGLERLAQYWFRANIMNDLLHTMREMYDDDLKNLKGTGEVW